MQTETSRTMTKRWGGSLKRLGLPLILTLLAAGLALGLRPAAAAIEVLPTQTSTTCGSIQHVTVVVTTAAGVPVADATSISFTTSLGYISSPVATRGGRAVAQLVIPSRVTGTATVGVSGAGFTASKAINVTCDIPPPQPVLRPAIPIAMGPAPLAAAAPAAAAPAAFNLSAFEYGYAPNAFTVRANQNVSVNVTNTGRLSHTFTIAGVTNTGTVAAGQSRGVQFNAGAPRTLTFYCTIHGAAVMSGTIAVTP